jgi:transposase
MLVFEFKAYGKSAQFAAVDEAIRTAKFVRNSCLRYWMDDRSQETTGEHDNTRTNFHSRKSICLAILGNNDFIA